MKARLGVCGLNVVMLIVAPLSQAAMRNQVPGGTAVVDGLQCGSTADFADAHQGDAIETLHLVAGRSLVLNTKIPMKRIYVGNPAVLQSYNSGPEEVVLTAKSYGMSSLVLWDVSGQSHMYSISVDVDGDAARNAFKSAYPQEDLGLTAREGRLFITGDVPSEAAAEAAVKIASSYSKDVVNGLRVVQTHAKQVQLKLKIVEVDRSKMDQFGINLFASGRTPFNTSTQQYTTTATTGGSAGGTSVSVSDPLNIFLYNYKLNLGVTIKDLESKQVLQVLAEPTLTTLSGSSAKFLAGGEFPVPIVQGGTGNSTAITIVYKPFGVKVDFSPTVNRDGTIRLKVAPEVSTLDYTNAIVISGTTVPALSTRRAETEVELRDGESFILSGLLDHRTTDSLSNVPGISSVPFIGQLFRSKGINRSVIELVVLVTATVVDPLKADAKGASGGHQDTMPSMSVPNLQSKDFDAVFRPLVKSDQAKQGKADGVVPKGQAGVVTGETPPALPKP